jgi:predicted ArsR family transcriptional regulator
VVILYIPMRSEKVEKPSRQRIIHHLKKNDWVSVADLSKKVGITPMAVRQHLIALERQGMIHNVVKKTGIGRPVYLYGLTDRAESIFPKAYGRFINEVFQTIEDSEGRNKIDSIFKARKDKILSEREGVLSELPGQGDKVRTMAEMLNQNGYMVELEEIESGYNLKQFNCPINEVAQKYNEACKYELELYRDLFGGGVQRSSCLSNGDTSCSYFIPF